MEAGPEIEAHHHHHTGRRWLDITLGVSAVLISLCSLFLAIENGSAMHQLVAANSWPFLKIGVSNGDENGRPLLALVMQNKGVGPAKVRTLEVSYKGRFVSGPRPLIEAILGPDAGAKVAFTKSRIVGSVLSSRESVNFTAVVEKDVAPAQLNALAQGGEKIGLRVCYCSVFDECWMLDHIKGTSEPLPIKACPAPQVPFEN